MDERDDEPACYHGKETCDLCRECDGDVPFGDLIPDPDGDTYDLGMDPDEGLIELPDGSIPRKMRTIATNYEANFWTGDGKRFIRKHRKAVKRRAAMRRQGKGGTR